ncbi:UNVERIFIED_CONTAM: hypothetical protein GTU68_043275 [Idotea baltica]|nr:hypothetical protein [Idotea baltica]
MGSVKVRHCGWCGDIIEDCSCACGCGEVFYCGREHQRLDWPEHYAECKPYKIRSSTEAGQYMVAVRNLKAGAQILKDEPMVVGPLGTSELLCLACHAPIYDENFYKCPCCFWPMCSLDCASAKVHDNECAILSEDENQYGAPTTQGDTPRYDLIMIIRCLLLRTTNPKAWDTLLSMASHGCSEIERKSPHQVAAVRYLTEVCKVDYDADTIHYVRGVVRTNALEIRGPKGTRLRALYPMIRIFNHSCSPNIHLSCDLEGVMEAKTATSVEKGDSLCICYTGTDVPLWERQACLLDIHHFDCLCERCTDPTEMGTMFSSSRCLVCPQEIMKPFICNGCITWKCQKCGAESSAEEIKQEIEEWMFRLQMNELFGTGTPNRISHALAVIELHFHIKHFIWLKAGQAALLKIKYNDSFDAMKLRKYIWEKMLDIYNRIEPGLTRRRGM